MYGYAKPTSLHKVALVALACMALAAAGCRKPKHHKQPHKPKQVEVIDLYDGGIGDVTDGG